LCFWRFDFSRLSMAVASAQFEVIEPAQGSRFVRNSFS
jgi:hypothetical protein